MAEATPPGATGGPPAAVTSRTSPTNTRARSSTCTACSTTWPPERVGSVHQATGGTLSNHVPCTRRTVRPAISRACSTVVVAERPRTFGNDVGGGDELHVGKATEDPGMARCHPAGTDEPHTTFGRISTALGHLHAVAGISGFETVNSPV